jgi:dihydroxyacid dehydratase/phosphogluconate dehydratase
MAVVALCLLAFTLRRCAVSDAVEADRKAVESETAKKVLGAERTANRADVTRQAEIQASDAATRKAIDDAVAKHPETVPAGPATRAAADSLRNR